MRLIPSSLLLAIVCLAPAGAQDTVLVGRSANGRHEAFLSGADGLVVTGWSAAPGGVLRVGHGSEPRLDSKGNLYFTRVVDDGRHVLRTSTLVVESGRVRPRSLRNGEVAPAYRLPKPVHSLADVKVCVDAGHGGTDPGGSGNGLREKDVVLDMARRLKALLDLDSKDTRGGGSWSVLMTRSTDVFVSLSQRTNMANAFGAKTFLSVHMNSFGSASANGSETFCMTGQERNAGGTYRNRLQRELLGAWGLRNRGTKTARFFVLRNTRMPAALVEGGFITNAVDARKLGDATARQRLALGLLWATQEQHGFQRYTPSTGGGGSKGVLRGVIYDVSRGTGVRVPGATVSLAGGQFVVGSSSSAAFSFSLSPGIYTYAATAPGYEPASLIRVVTANQTIWGSLGLRPANVPGLAGAGTFPAGSTVALTLRGDRGSPVLLVLGPRPGFPVFTFGGFGKVWPDLAVSLVFAVGAVPANGTMTMRFRTPRVPGLRAHVQCLVRSGGSFRTTNGVGIGLR